MSTTNLNLDTIETTDSISNAFLTKMNGNMNKLDSAYGILKAHLLQKTGKTNLNDAINYIDSLVNAQDATATADKLFNGYTAYKGTQKITGTALATETTATATTIRNGYKAYNNNGELITGTGYATSTTATASDIKTGKTAYNNAGTLIVGTYSPQLIPTINVTLTGTNSSYISGYGAGINKDGVLVIWAMSNSTAYEHVSFSASSIGTGTTGSGWSITSYDTSDPSSVPYACTITGLSGKNTIDITLNANTLSSSYDYVQLAVTLTAS